MKRLLIISIAVAFVVGVLGLSYAKAEPPIMWHDVYTRLIPAGEFWLDPFWNENTCDFDVTIDYDERFIIHVYDDHELWNIRIRDTYTNEETGFSFLDFASYSIRVDYVFDGTEIIGYGLATHQGVFWRIVEPGTGVILKDMGQFVQDWGDPNWPVLLDTLKGANHDVNFVWPPFGYCDLLEGYVPE